MKDILKVVLQSNLLKSCFVVYYFSRQTVNAAFFQTMEREKGLNMRMWRGINMMLAVRTLTVDFQSCSFAVRSRRTAVKLMLISTVINNYYLLTC